MSPMYIPGLTSSRWPLVPGLTHSSLWSSEAGGVSYLLSPSRGISAHRCTPVLPLDRHEKHKEPNRSCSFRSPKNYLQKGKTNSITEVHVTLVLYWRTAEIKVIIHWKQQLSKCFDTVMDAKRLWFSCILSPITTW